MSNTIYKKRSMQRMTTFTFLFALSWLTFSDESLPADKPHNDTQVETENLSNKELRQMSLPTISEDVEGEPEIESEKALTQVIERKQILEEKAIKIPFVILPHRPNYIMPVSYTQSPHDDEIKEALGDSWPGYSNVEAMFQISLKYQVHQFDKENKNRLYVAYTNKSFWQVYSEKISRPFRETNHEPELFLQLTPNWGYINQVTLSLNHQSNGQFQRFSRSWNRIIAGFYHRSGSSVYGLEPWWRIPETDKADPNDPTDNDNPDIHKYLGYGSFIWYKKVGQESLLFRFGNNLNPDENRGWGELEFTFPLGRRFLGFVQYYEGYGHSLIEYNQYQRRIGIGLKISDYL
jgi:phospholipase A1